VRLPRDVSGRALAKALSKVGYTVTRQTGSHIRLTTQELGEHHVTVPDHDPIRVGTLAGLLSDIADHLGIGRDELVRKLFLD
jgi:predicted RNA binding protein YcfA (HicA-like mRNA interferase family)